MFDNSHRHAFEKAASPCFWEGALELIEIHRKISATRTVMLLKGHAYENAVLLQTRACMLKMDK